MTLTQQCEDALTHCLWDVSTGREIKRFEWHTSPVYSVNFSPDGRSIASGSSDKTIRLWDVSTGREIKRFEGHTSSINSVNFSPVGRSIVSGSSDGTIILYFNRNTSGALHHIFIRGIERRVI